MSPRRYARWVNLVGHVAAALPDGPSPEFLAGCVLPDVAAICRVRLTGPMGASTGASRASRASAGPSLPGGIAAGVAFHHECDHAFHSSPWFNRENVRLRDALLAAGVDRGPARATAHAGLEMLLDGALVEDPRLDGHVRVALETLDAHAGAIAALAAPPGQERWVVGVRRIADSLDPAGYADPASVTLRVQRMTAGRARIELHADQAAAVTAVLAGAQPGIAADAHAVLAGVRRDVAAHRVEE